MPRFHHHHHGGKAPRQSAPSLPPPSEPSTEFVVLDPATVRFRREGQRLRLERDGTWLEVTLVRLFPLTEPDGWVAVLDEEGREVGILLDLGKLRKGSRAAAEEELQRRYLVPEITRLLECKPLRHHMMRWVVETDRGPATFTTRNLRDQIKEPSPRRLSLIDVEGNRYDIPDINALDLDSRRLLQSRI
ncbi:MAG: DUF1854 domain-containing protein [Planctomycetota bacterium]